MKRKTRLSRKETSKKVNRLDKVRDAVSSEFRAEDTKTVKNYARLKDKDVADNPTLALLKAESLNELARRQSTLSEWKSGKIPPVSKDEKKPKESFIRKLVKGEQKVAGLVGKGFQEYMKVISGEKARDIEEGIATIGMKPEDKKKFLEQERKKEAEAEKKELEEERSFYPGGESEEEMEKDMPLHAKEAKEFADHRKALDEGHEPVRAQEPEHIRERRERYEDEESVAPKRRRTEESEEVDEEKPVPIVINVNVGGKRQRAEVVNDIPGMVAEGKAQLSRDKEAQYEEENVTSIIDEGRAEMEAEQREIEKLKREGRRID